MNLPHDKLIAAIDIGSNSIHLIVARMVQGALQPIERYRERVQLAAGLNSELVLDQAAMDRGLACLERMGSILQRFELDQVRVVATHTLRQAKNRNVFIRQAEKLLHYNIDVISGREEARLIFQGVSHVDATSDEKLVIDIGGGSTELALGTGFDPHFRESCMMGCVSFSQQFFAEGVSRSAFKEANFAALRELEQYLSQLGGASWKNVFATSGTAKALEAIAKVVSASSQGIELKALRKFRESLVADGDLSSIAAYGINADRVELIPGGLAIMIAIMESLSIKRVSYCDVALREGVLYELDEQMRHPDIRLRTRQSLQARYHIDAAFGESVAQTACWLVEQSLSVIDISDKVSIDVLYEAAHLHEIGLQISASGLQKHSAYVLLNSDLPGYSQDQQLLLASLVRCYRKRLDISLLPEFPHLSVDQLMVLTLILRLAVLINASRRQILLDRLSVSVSPSSIQFSVDQALLDRWPLLHADLLREQKYLRDVKVNFDIVIEPNSVD